MNTVHRLRWYVLAEGLSYLVLLCVAMPMKYLFGMPMVVRIVGGLHGLLFIALVSNLYDAHVDRRWKTSFTLTLLAASLLPGSLVWMDRRLRERSAPETTCDRPPG